jgi:hypothetical protein
MPHTKEHVTARLIYSKNIKSWLILSAPFYTPDLDSQSFNSKPADTPILIKTLLKIPASSNIYRDFIACREFA